MLSDQDKLSIQEAYSCFLASKGWTARLGQKQMVAEIARTIGGIPVDEEGVRQDDAGHICVIEAGTGTGKTIAYCLAAIPLAKSKDKTLIISTATVALQEQIVFKDLPDLRQHSGLEFQFALAKGRARYLCPAKLDSQLEGSVDQAMALYPDEVAQPVNESSMALFEEMLTTMAEGKWNGDRDAWPKHIDPVDWAKVTTDHHQCAGRRCAYISQCPFFKARDRIQGVDVVVANHDLVLADLSLGGGAILPAPEECLYVFDEAHHLPDKAVNHFAFHSRVEGSKKSLKQAEKSIASMSKALSGLGNLQHKMEQVDGLLGALQSQITLVLEYLEQGISFPEAKSERGYNSVRRFRFKQGIVPEALQHHAEMLTRNFFQLRQVLTGISEQLDDAIADDFSGFPKHDIEQWYPMVGALLARVNSSYGLWHSFSVADDDQKTPKARWITLREDSTATGGVDFELCSSPIQSASLLEESIWRRCFSAVLTSATLTALKSFERFRWRCGTPQTANYLSIQSPFNFSNALLQIPALEVEPSDTQAHTQAITDFISGEIEKQGKKAEGILVLFSSRKQMEAVYFGLSKDEQSGILMQGDLSKQEMIEQHKKTIDAGNSSILFGLASFSEGVDLPGDYCTHVVIAKIPFSVPDDPVEEAMSEWVEKNGGNPFMEITVPDAAMKLVQACGRLLRNEKDKGTITLLDKRIISKRYGKAMLDSLPPYRLLR